ncbi:MAG: hypothetical protein PG981_000924 [Wolbachia endosymbiont of Ctenocephalides orientis wCori]|nr:MAG: hypothetical protein PG981_000924 [Wolbachia endosymbiont of Ctenocephalides orientis wCori]
MGSYPGKYLLSLMLIATYILITGCDKNDMPFPRCLSADYFGPKPVAVGAHFSSDHSAFIPRDGEIIDHNTGEVNYGFHNNQVVRWKDTGFETNGDSLVVRVNGAWTSWSNNNKKEFKGSYSLEGLEKLKYETKYENHVGDNALPDFHLICSNYKSVQRELSNTSSASCSVNCKCIDENNNAGSVSRSVPCWFTNGHGAYLLFRRTFLGNDGTITMEPDPNDSLQSMRNPQSPTVHLGYNSMTEGDIGIFTLDRNNSNLKDRKCSPIKLEKGWKIYVKILDGYYLDNAGGYSFEFLRGVQKPEGFGYFDYVYHYLKCVLLINKNCKQHFDSDEPAAAQAMFKGIAENSTSFHNFVLSLLVLYIVISSLLYLFGMAQDTRHDMLIRMMKITLIVVLISPGSFEFFYNHFLILFIEGFEQLIKIITNFAPNSNTDGLFTFIENMFNKFFAYSVWKKFAAFLHYQMWASVFMIPAIVIGIVLYFLLCIYAYVIFLSGFIGLAFLIVIMPLFLISILFSPLKSLFEGWIKFCISFCLQSVMIFTLLSLLGALIMNTFYKQLGFTVCYNKWLEIRLCVGGLCILDEGYFGWTPGQIFVPYAIGEEAPINIDKSIEGIESMSRARGTVKFTGGAGYINLPPDYVEKGFRYIDYPFFNPIPGTKDNPADHYIGENDILVNKDCSQKELVRLANSLSHAVEKLNILSLINAIDKKIGGIDRKISEYYCQPSSDVPECENYHKVIDEYRSGTIRPDLKNKIKSLVSNVVVKEGHCTVQNFYNVNDKYQENSDYQRVQDIKRGYLINAGDIFVLFLLSFLMFSLRQFVQEMGSSLAGGGYSVYSISRMYEGSLISGIIQFPKHKLQEYMGGALGSLGGWAAHLPNRLAGGTANLIARYMPLNVTVFSTRFNLTKLVDAPRKLVNVAVETTKFVTSPKNGVDRLEKKIYRAFGVDEEDIAHRRIGRYLDYYRGYLGSHLGYTIDDAMEFAWEHALDSVGANSATGEGDGYQSNLLYRAKSQRREFLDKLHDYTIGRTRVPEENEDKDNNKSGESVIPNSPHEDGSSESIIPNPTHEDGSSESVRRNSLDELDSSDELLTDTELPLQEGSESDGSMSDESELDGSDSEAPIANNATSSESDEGQHNKRRAPSPPSDQPLAKRRKLTDEPTTTNPGEEGGDNDQEEF